MATGESAYLGIKADGASGGYAEFTSVRDFSMPSTVTFADMSRRSLGNKVGSPGLHEIVAEGNCVKDTADAVQIILRTAFFAKTKVIVQVRASNATSEGVQFDAFVTEWSEDQPLDDTIMIDFKLELASAFTLLAAT